MQYVGNFLKKLMERRLLAGTFEQQIAAYDHGSYEFELERCEDCGSHGHDFPVLAFTDDDKLKYCPDCYPKNLEYAIEELEYIPTESEKKFYMENKNHGK